MPHDRDFEDDFDDDYLDLVGSQGPFKGEVYYDPERNVFVQLRERGEDIATFSHYCRFYEDAKTTLVTECHPVEYMEKLVKVGKIEEFPFAERHPQINAWQVKNPETAKTFDD